MRYETATCPFIPIEPSASTQSPTSDFIRSKAAEADIAAPVAEGFGASQHCARADEETARNAAKVRRNVERRIEARERVIADLLGTRVSERSVARRPAGAALRGLLHQLQQMAQLLALGAEVVPGDVGRRDFQGDALDDLEAVAVERDVLARIVGHQAHAADSQVAQDLGADAVIALVGPEAQALVGLDRVVSLLLQLVGAQLVHQADAA